jgi:hypothetical protein
LREVIAIPVVAKQTATVSFFVMKGVLAIA